MFNNLKMLFRPQKFHSDEEYKAFLLAKQRMYMLISAFGVLLMGMLYLTETVFAIEFSDHMLGFYSGGSSGLIAVGIVLIIRNRRILNNPEMLHKLRIKSGDERNILIASSAVRWACMIQLFAACGLALFGNLFDPILTFVGVCLIYLYLFTYLVSYYVLSRKM